MFRSFGASEIILLLLLAGLLTVAIRLLVYRAGHGGSGKKWDGIDWFLLLALQWPYFFLRKWIRGIRD